VKVLHTLATNLESRVFRVGHDFPAKVTIGPYAGLRRGSGFAGFSSESGEQGSQYVHALRECIPRAKSITSVLAG